MRVGKSHENKGHQGKVKRMSVVAVYEYV